jgi:hypothetical protein
MPLALLSERPSKLDVVPSLLNRLDSCMAEVAGAAGCWQSSRMAGPSRPPAMHALALALVQTAEPHSCVRHPAS